MAVPASTAALSVPTTTDPNAKTDLRARSLIGQIEDWATCPTTDSNTKNQIVGKLSSELSDVYKEISSKDSKTSAQTGVGANLDLSA